MNVPVWRVALGIAVLVALAALAVVLTPIYFRDLNLQQYVAALAEKPETIRQPDDLIRTQIVEKAGDLRLPVHIDDVQIQRTPEALRIQVKYIVRVNLVLYTVDLHFYPGAGSH